jgi:hypothetical protein
MYATLIVIAAIFVLLVIISVINGNELNIERTVSIKKPLTDVFDYIKLLKHQDNYNVWVMKDPLMKKDFKGIDGTKGFVYAWDSKDKDAGAGEQQIESIENNRCIEYIIRFERPMKSIASAKFLTQSQNNEETNVTWGFYSKMKFPLTVIKPMMLKMLSGDMAKSLQNLKSLMEK